MKKKGTKSKKKKIEHENVDAKPIKTPLEGTYEVDVLIPKYRIEKALRHHLDQPLTKGYIETVHHTIDYLANRFLLRMVEHSTHTFSMRNTWLEEANRKPKTRMDDGVLSDLYYEVGEKDVEKLDAIHELIRDLTGSIGFFKTAESIQHLLFAGKIPRD
ncbi:MAG: hypothetical protein LN415_06975 [Candidatus Thermoplasmatota archaeon]|nr:hypothetical protein [Candidatus Thermoplasmatota archaeon]